MSGLPSRSPMSDLLIRHNNETKTTVLQGRCQGGPGVPVTSLLEAFFSQTTYNRWRKCHADILPIFKKRFF